MPRLLLVLALTACGSSGSKDWVPSDIDENQTLDRLGAAGYQKMCGAFADYVRDMYRTSYLIQAACTAHALETTSDAVACGEAANACRNDVPAAVESTLDSILAQASCTAVSATPAGCSMPVSALTACLDALGERIDEIKFSLTCAAFGSPIPSDWYRIAPPPACSALASGC
jgi:hypothetical protein